ncbi:class F sortase [Nocardioides sp.]|uniref:class F sortase n=1 Tax=Nocardioides sp. TaxID=35761 RepID=UPI002ED03436
MIGRSGRLVAAAAMAVLGGGLLVAAQSPSDPAPLPDRATTLGTSAVARDEERPAAATGRTLPPQWPEFVPTRVSLGEAADGVTAAVDPVSVVAGTLELPGDADRVGWWRAGSLAGAPFGTVLVAGHLDSDTDPAGYLAALAELAPGDVVELAGDGDRQHYRVTRNYLLARANLSQRSDLFEQDRPHRLVLVTCGGAYDVAAGRYQFNRIVEARPVP